MTHKKVITVFVFTILAALVFGVYQAQASERAISTLPESAALGGAFTYEGQLIRSSEPYNGSCDFRFKLWQAQENGTQIGSEDLQDAVRVQHGLFVVTLNDGGEFGNAGIFNGQPLWLEVAVRCPAGGTGNYVTLAPRQPLTPAPYALFATSVPWSGLTDIPAGFADGVDDGSSYTAGSGLALDDNVFSVTGAPWSGLTGVPTGFADGTDNDTTYTAGTGLLLTGGQFSLASAYRLPQSCTSGQLPKWNGTAWACSSDTNTTYTAGSGLSLDENVFSVTGAPWGGITDVPAGFSDGVDNDTTYTAGTGLSLASGQFSLSNAYRLPQSCTNGQLPKWDGTAWACGSDNNTTYTAGHGLALSGTEFSATSPDNLIIVAKSGGDFTTIQAAINSITDASATNRYVVYVAPGVYTGVVTMKSYVDVRGASQESVVISYQGFSYETNGVVIGASNAELSNLTVQMNGTGTWGTCLAVPAGVENLRVSDVLIKYASGDFTGFFRGVYVVGKVDIRDSRIIGDLADITTSGAYGVYVAAGGTAYLDSVDVEVYTDDHSFGVFTDDQAYQLTILDSTIIALTDSPTGGAGVGTSFTWQNTVLSGCYIVGSQYGVQGMQTSASTGVEITNSKIIGIQHTIIIIDNSGNLMIYVGGTHLYGGATGSSIAGKIKCAGVYDENFVFSASTCP